MKETGETIEQVQNRLPSVEQINGYLYADEEGRGYTSNEINQVLELAQNELMNLPEDYSDIEYIDHLKKEISVLENMLKGKLDDADAQLAWELLNRNVKRDDEAILHQSAMYKSPLKNFKYFYNQVFEKENAKTKSKKSYFDFNNANISVRIPHDTVVHDKNKHKLSTDEWVEVLNNLDKPVDVAVSSKPRFDGQPILLKVVGKNQVYGIVVEFFENKQPIITTAFADKEANIDKWLNKNRSAQAKNTSSVTTKGMLLSQDHNTIMNYLKEKFNPKVKNNVLFQSTYHGGAKDFDRFDLSYALSGEGAMAHGYGVYTAKNKNVSEGYRKRLTDGYSSTQYEYKNKTYTVLYDGNEDLHIKEDTSNLNETEKDLILDLAISDSQEELLEELKDTKQNYEEEIVTVIKNGKSEEYAKKDYDKEGYNRVLSKIKILESGEIKTTKAKGQLYEVDIPEDDVLLDEDKLLGDMILKEGLIDKLLDWANENGLYYQIDLTKNGAEIYDAIANKLGSDKLASEKLNELGLKGIKYNGREDGECYVIFDDKAVEVLKKYYQTSNSTSLNFESFEELQEAFKNDIEQTPEDYKINDLEKALKDLGITEDKPKEVKTPYETIQVRARNIEHIINSKGDKTRYKSINRMFATLERPNIITVDKQGKRAYFKIFEDNNKTKRQITYVSTDKQGNFVLTTIPVKRNKKFINAINKGNIIYQSRKGVINNSPDNNSITDVDTNFNPKVKNNVLYNSEQQNIFPGNRKAKEIHKVKGGYLPVEKFIELFKNADASTIVHELAHWYLDELTRTAQYSEEIAQDLEAVRKYLKNEGEDFTREQHEKFARSFEAYILTGSSKNNKLRKIFEDFKNWLLQIYDELKNLGIAQDEMSEINKLFDRLLTSEKQRSAAVFNKVNIIEEKIADIKQKQEKELDELDEIYETNIQENNRKSDKKRKVEEYLELASKAAKKEPKEVKEFRERYKEATLQILEVATGYDRTFIAQKRNASKIEEAINNVEDKIIDWVECVKTGLEMVGFDNPDKFFKDDDNIDQIANFIKQLPENLQQAVFQNIQPMLQQAQVIMQQGGANGQG